MYIRREMTSVRVCESSDLCQDTKRSNHNKFHTVLCANKSKARTKILHSYYESRSTHDTKERETQVVGKYPGSGGSGLGGMHVKINKSPV